MGDFPLLLLTATIWTYWFSVGFMIVRLRRKTRKLVGVVPEQRVERYMWLVWVPLVAAWCVLPYLALSRTAPPLGLPAFAREMPAYATLRGAAIVVAVGLPAADLQVLGAHGLGLAHGRERARADEPHHRRPVSPYPPPDLRLFDAADAVLGADRADDPDGRSSPRSTSC